jgi:hypothetical protein
MEYIMTQYKRRNIKELDMLGDFYSKHFTAMEVEGIAGIPAIAAELGYRDMLIVQLRQVLLLERAERAKEQDAHEEWAHLANQTLRTR